MWYRVHIRVILKACNIYPRQLEKNGWLTAQLGTRMHGRSSNPRGNGGPVIRSHLAESGRLGFIAIICSHYSDVTVEGYLVWSQRTGQNFSIELTARWPSCWTSLGLLCPTHVSFLAFNANKWSRLVRFSAARRPYDHIRSWDWCRWWWGIDQWRNDTVSTKSHLQALHNHNRAK